MSETTTENTELAVAAEAPRRGELVAVPPKAGSKLQPIVPATMEELKYVSGLVIKCGLAPDSYDNDPQKIAIGIMKGLEVGLPPLTALSTIAIINKRPCIWGDGAIALVQAQNVITKMEVREVGTVSEGGEVSDFGDDYGFEVSIWRKGQETPYVGRFTVGDAKRAKLWLNPRKQPWMLYPKRMLKIRATAFPLRDGFADCLSGLHIREEIEDMPAPPPVADNSMFDDDTKPETAAA
jgi:hypothetical protein